MPTYLLYGKFTPEFWQTIRRDPEAAPALVRKMAERSGCLVEHFFFALEEFDFYAAVSGERPEDLTTVRNQLMADGAFRALHAEQLFTFAELFPGERASVEA